MFRCSERLMRWYVNKGLAELINESPKTARLLFKPQGLGKAGDEFYCGHKTSQCIVCGDNRLENLSSHHIVPYCFRRHFPIHIKASNSHDVLPLCIDCHESYTKVAHQVVKVITEPYSRLTEEVARYNKVVNLARAYCRAAKTMPLERRNEIKRILSEHFKQPMNSVGIKEIAERPSKTLVLSRLVVNDLKDLYGFVIFWRKHLVETMKPRFLPEGWDIYKRI